MTKILLLIAESFPPLNNIAAQRFPPMLPILEERGWQVWVLTQNASGSMPVRLPETQIIRIGQHHQEGLEIRLDSHFSRGSRMRAMARAAVRSTRLSLRAVDSSLLTWARPVLGQLPAIQARLPRVDVVLGTFPHSAGLWLARRLGTAYGAPWIADFRDLAALRPDARARYAQWLDRRMEARLLRSAAAVTTCGRHWADTLACHHGREVNVVYNGWDLRHLVSDAELSTDSSGVPGDRPFLYYAGRFYDRQLESISRVLQAIDGTPFKLVIRSLGPREREERIIQAAEQAGVRAQLRLLPPVPHGAVFAEAGRAAANLVLDAVDSEEDWTRGSLLGKFLQLLPLEPPIMFVARADSEAGEILERTGKGALCTSIDDIRRHLRDILAGVSKPVNRAAVLELSKARQGERLLEIIEAVHARAGTRLLASGLARENGQAKAAALSRGP